MAVKNALRRVCLLSYFGLVVLTSTASAKNIPQRDFYSSVQIFSQSLPTGFPSDNQMHDWTEELIYLYLWTKDNFVIQQETQFAPAIQKFADYLSRWEKQVKSKPVATQSAYLSLNAAFLLMLHEYDASLAVVKQEKGQYAQLIRVLVGDVHPEYPQVWQISPENARKLVQLYPDSLLAKMTFIESVLEMEQDNPQKIMLLRESEKLVSKTTGVHSNNLYFIYQKTQLMYYLGQEEKAIQAFDSLLKQAPQNAILTEAIGNFYRWVKRYPQALRVMEAAQKMQPKQPRLYRKLEHIYLELDKPLAAVQMYLSGLLLMPEESSFYDALIELAAKVETQELARLTASSLEKAPRHAYLHIFQGEVFLLLGQKEAAKITFEKAVRLSPPLPQAFGSLFYVYWQDKDWDALQQLLVEARKLPNILPQTYYWAGLAAIEMNQPKLAIEELNKASLKDPSVQQALVMAYKQDKQFSKARELLQLMLKENPKDVRLLLSMGDIYIDEKKIEKAEDYYLWAHKLDPYNPNIYFSLGNLYADSNRTDLAVDAFERSILIQPGDLDSRNNLGNVLLKNRDYLEAILHFKRILKMNPDYATAYYNIACAYSLNRQKETALLFLKQALEKDKKLKNLAVSDPDFESLRQEKTFQELVR